MSFARILVPYEGSPLSQDALELACDLAQPGGAITAVYVVRTPPNLPIGAEDAAAALGKELLGHAAETGRQRNVSVETKLLRADDVPAGIVRAAQEAEAEAIVMSLRHKHTLGETMVLSHTASRVLRHAPCRVLITHRRES